MYTSTMILMSVGITAILMSNSAVTAVPPPQCSPIVLMNADPKYRQICFVLNQLQTSLDVPDDRGMDVLPEGFEPIETGIKRKDVDHVFLRFGRPRI